MNPVTESRSKIHTAWYGQKVFNNEYLLKDLSSHLPEFTRESFGTGDGTNNYLQKIVRQPIDKDKRQIPVATVSKRYALIQHAEVCNWLVEGLRALDYYSEDVPVRTLMSEYGERLHLSVHVPKYDFDPGDNEKLHLMLEARNSVDRSCAFEIRLRWYRLICSNGMWALEEDVLRKIHHIDWMNRANVGEFIHNRVEHFSGYQEMIQLWHKTEVSLNQIDEWADGKLTKKWGVQLAARCCHIARSGYDGIVGRASAKVPSSQYSVSSDKKVPGAFAPISNLYHLSQALTWLADHRTSIEDSDKKTSDIPSLLKHFVKEKVV